MPDLLAGAAGVRMELANYYADFQDRYAKAREFWKLERGQSYAEPGNPSWEAFDAGDWEQSLRLIEADRAEVAEYLRGIAARGTVGRRVRVVELPPEPYLQWELHVLRLRDELGQATRVIRARDLARREKRGSLDGATTAGEPGGLARRNQKRQSRGRCLQARDVSGGVHFHRAQEEQRGQGIVPHQLPADIGIFADRQPESRSLTRMEAGMHGRG